VLTCCKLVDLTPNVSLPQDLVAVSKVVFDVPGVL
jgi:hypothetical protein